MLYLIEAIAIMPNGTFKYRGHTYSNDVFEPADNLPYGFTHKFEGDDILIAKFDSPNSIYPCPSVIVGIMFIEDN